MSHTEKLEQAVLGEESIVQPETADTSERHREQTCFKLSGRPTPAIDIVHKTDVNTDINHRLVGEFSSKVYLGNIRAISARRGVNRANRNS